MAAAAASLLRITLHEGTGYPVGKVNALDLHPLSFRELLEATGNVVLRELIDGGDEPLLDALSAKFEQLLKQCYLIGGMPEAVSAFVETGALDEVCAVQDSILFGHERDVSKHLGATATEPIPAAWHSVSTQLGKESKKSVFGHIGEGARTRSHRVAITWLTWADIAIRVPRVTKPGLSLVGYAEKSAFKLFLVYVGLLGATAGLDGVSSMATRSSRSSRARLPNNTSVSNWFRNAVSPCIIGLPRTCVARWTSSCDSRESCIQSRSRWGGTPCSRSLWAFSEGHKGMSPRRLFLSGFRDQSWMKNAPLPVMGPVGNCA